MTTATKNKHSRVGASSAKRWMACPGSVALCSTIKDEPSDFAKEGSAAHALAEVCLKFGAEKVLSLPKEDLSFFGYLEEKHIEWVNDDMRKHVKDYVDAVNKAYADIPDNVLHVIDFKYGAGQTVEVERNVQQMYYALGAAKKVLPNGEKKMFIEEKVNAGPAHLNLYGTADIIIFGAGNTEEVKTTIFQPRKEHFDGPERSFTMSLDELLTWGLEELEPAAEAALKPNAPLHAGDWCTEGFCKARKKGCPALKTKALALAKVEFSDLDNIEDISLPEIETMSLEDCAKVLAFSGIFTSWIKEMKAHMFELAKKGTKIPGFKLVNKQAKRIWKDREEVIRLLTSLGFTEEKMFEPSVLRSVAQMEKKLGKKMVKPLQETPFTGLTLAPESSNKPEVTCSAAAEFTKLT